MFLLDQQKQSKEGGATDNDPPIQLFSSTSTQQESQYCVEMSCDCLKPGEEVVINNILYYLMYLVYFSFKKLFLSNLLQLEHKKLTLP